MAEYITLRVERRNPETELESRIETYEIPKTVTEGMTLVNALKYVQERLDPSLAFYYSCELAKCRGCVLEANGKAVFACTEPLRDGLTLGPLSDLPVLRDLVVKFLPSEIVLDEGVCTGCEACVEACPMDIYEMTASGDHASVKAGPIKDTAGGHAVDCIGCARCEAACKAGAIEIRPLEITRAPAAA